MRLVLAVLAFLSLLRPASAASVCDVTSFGAKGDRQALDTAAIQKAIEACHRQGGGVVYFPSGNFLSGTLVLRSNVTLHLSPGAVLWGSTRMADYSPKHLLFAQGVENVAIEGGGVIDGQGDAFLDADLKPLPRPSPLVELLDSRRIRIENVTIRKAPAWTLHARNCDDVKVRGISLLNNLRGVNTDGIDVDSSRNVVISDSHIEAGDDCIVLKTTDRGGPAGPTENVVVTNCVLVSAATALKLGTESHGDFRHCVFSNCVIRDSRTGVALLAKDGGVMEDIRFSNIVMTTRPKWGQGLEWPIVVDVEKRTAESRLSRVRDVAFSHLTLYTPGRVMASGTPESPIENLSFDDVLFRVTGYEEIKAARKMRGGAKTVAEGMPDYAATPAAFIFAYVKGLVLGGLTTVWPAAGAEPAPERSAVYGDHLEDVLIHGFHGLASVPGAAPIRIERSSGVRQ